MISAELRAQIRRLYFAEHWKVGTIASELHVHHDAVRRAVLLERVCNGDSSMLRPTVLAPYKDFIVQALEQHPRLRATRLYEMVKSRGYLGGVAQLRRFVRVVRPASQAEAYLRLSTMPGEQAQVDWGSFGKLQVGSAQRTLSCFVLVLSWSRAIYARFMLDQTLESFLRGHVLAFEALGGVPRSALYDNLKSVVLERMGDAIRFHPRLLELAGHYHFAPKPCAPYRGNEKGKVERAIRYLRDSFFAARSFKTLEDLNAQLARWIEEIAHQRRQPGSGAGRRVRDALEEERPRLLPLPEHRFETDVVLPVASGKTPYIRFDGNDYSIPHTLVKRPLTLVASETTVRILDGKSSEVAKHQRSYDKGKPIEDPSHIAELAKVKRHAHELRGRDLLRTVCKNAEALLKALADRGDHLGHHTVRLLHLLDRYGHRELDRAIADAMARGALGADAVAHVLDQRSRKKKAPPPLEVVLPDDPRIKNLRVLEHSLTPYDALGQNDDGEERDR
jgi:transposase